jgi:HSP20 family molecular chaperone IbpA
MSSGWSQQQPSSIFNMNPLDVISNFISPVMDIVSPLEDIRTLWNQGARMYGQAPPVLPRIVQQRRRKMKAPSVKRGPLLPQKYRIVIDCTGICDPKTLKTNIKTVQDNKHLIVTSDMKKGRQFKRSYTLPVECETKKMTKYITPQCQLVIEFNYMDVPLHLAISPQHEICTTAEHGKCVHVKVPIADFVEPAKVKVHVKGRDLFVHFEERIAPFGDFCSRVIYHTRVQLPQNVNLNNITAKSDKHKLTILAPIGVKKGAAAPISQQLKDIAVKRKLRHRKARAVSVGAEQKQVPVTGEKKKEKKKLPKPSRPPPSGRSSSK